MTLIIRPIQRHEVPLLHSMLKEFAAYQNADAAMSAIAADLHTALFVTPGRLYCHLAFVDDEPAGCIVWYPTFSTYAGRSRIYLEDVYVRPAYRRQGVGRALIITIGQLCLDHGYAGLQWSVHRSSAESIQFYQSLGADIVTERLCCSLSGRDLQAIALQAPSRPNDMTASTVAL